MINISTVFSGIGAFEQALKKLNIDYKTIFACDNGEREIKESYKEIMEYAREHHYNNKQLNEYVESLYNNTKKTNRMKESYLTNYNVDEWYEDIRFIDGNQYTNQIDFFVGGSPCQSFSIIGKKAGLEDARGTLFYEYARLVNEIQPKVFIYENVPGMLMHDKGNTWTVIQEIFESLNYKIYYKVLNAQNYGIPQNRRRLFVVGFKDTNVDFSFPKEKELTTKLFDYLESNIPAKHYLGKKGFEFVTNEKYKNRARINRDIIQTEKANQQFNWNGDFIFEPLDKIKDRIDVLKRAYVGEWNNQIGVCRQLTYRECMRLMGFGDDFNIVVPNVSAYRQAGNSIVVNVLEEIIKEIMKVVKFDE